jgi:hypothetical protein
LQNGLWWKSTRGRAHSTTLAREPDAPKPREAFWSAAALRRLALIVLFVFEPSASESVVYECFAEKVEDDLILLLFC